jgi:hypothetical protein
MIVAASETNFHPLNIVNHYYAVDDSAVICWARKKKAEQVVRTWRAG